jgi:hypothetical protein
MNLIQLCIECDRCRQACIAVFGVFGISGALLVRALLGVMA